MRRLLIGGSPFQGRCPASEVNDGGCPEKPDHLRRGSHGQRAAVGAGRHRCGLEPLALRSQQAWLAAMIHVPLPPEPAVVTPAIPAPPATLSEPVVLLEVAVVFDVSISPTFAEP